MKNALAGLLFGVLVSCSNVPPVAVATCTAPQSPCGTACADLSKDDAHCGSCAVGCPTGQACAASACYPTSCGAMACDPNSVCVQDHCESKVCVGVLCPTGQQCVDGQCVCATGLNKCGDACVSEDLDSNNCGGCGQACDGGTSCAKGACIPDDCPQEDCDPLSVCFDGHCVERACVGVQCTAGDTCHDGECGCTSGMECGALCADTQLDSSHCGGCDTACDAGTRCAVGQCLPQSCGSVTCDPLSVCFAGTCIEAACVGVMCSGGNVCSAGVCVCPPDKNACGPTCADLMSSAQNCGACGHPCDVGESCVAGLCVVDTCMGGEVQCSGTCAKVQTDPDNCGACGDACGGGRNCVNGHCQCPQSLTLCGASCVNLVTDPQNCGTCGHGCGGGACGLDGGCSCTFGLTLCDGGCVDLLNDPNNCLTCGHACASGQGCNAGACGCPTGQKLCTGACRDIPTDNLNCGDCNVMCSGVQQCTNGVCLDPVTCQSSFNDAGTCSFFPLDDTHCGQPTVVETIPLMGTLATNGSELITALDGGPADRWDVTALYSSTAGSGTITARRWRNNLTNAIITTASNTVGTIAVELQDSLTGSLYTCSHSVDFVVRDTFNAPLSFDGGIVHSVLDHYNTGGTTFQNAARINLADGGMCQQLCGDVKRRCPDNSDSRELYRVTIPPKRAVLLEWRLVSGNGLSGSNVDFFAWTPAGAQLCDLAPAFTAFSTPTTRRNRIQNNTNAPEDVVFGFDTTLGGLISWNVAATLE